MTLFPSAVHACIYLVMNVVNPKKKKKSTLEKQKASKENKVQECFLFF